MKVVFSDHAWEDYLYWQENDPKLLKRVNTVIREIRRSPFSSTGKPEFPM